MSHAMFDRCWQSAMEELSDLVNLENPAGALDSALTPVPRPIPVVAGAAEPAQIKREVAFRHFSLLYLRYIRVVKDLQSAYDQIVHPQKRRDIRIALDASMTRLLQVKTQLSALNPAAPTSEYVQMNALLEELKMMPYDMELDVPGFIGEIEAGSVPAECRLTLAAAIDQFGLTDTPEEKTMAIEMTMPPMTLDDAIRLIQKNELGRQGLARGRMLAALATSSDQGRAATKLGEIDPVSAVLTLQRCFRGTLARLRSRADHASELRFLNMVPSNVPSHGLTLNPDAKADHDQIAQACGELRARRVRLRHDHEFEYRDQIEQIKMRVEAVRGPEFREKMWMERYEWWIDQKEQFAIEHENFDEFYRMKNPPPIVSDVVHNDTAADTKKGSKGKKAAKKDVKKDSKKDGKKGKKGSDGDIGDAIPYSILFGPEPIVSDLDRCVRKYTEVWAKLDESKNFKQTADPDLTTEKVTPNIIEKVRINVDNELMAVLDNLKRQVHMKLADESARTGKKGKKGAKPKSKGKSAKKGTKGKKKGEGTTKVKKCCDGEKALFDQSVNQSIDELVRIGILQKLPEKTKTISDFVGDFNYLGNEYEGAGITPDPSFAQIRTIVTESMIIPLGSPYVKENSPLVNAVLFYGPTGSGKTMLSKAVASATNAIWMDLSPETIATKVGSSKQEISRFVHLVFHVAKKAAPSVIYIDQIEKMFIATPKKKSTSTSTKNEGAGTDDMVKIKKEFVAHRDGLTGADRVLIIGNTSNPFDPAVDLTEMKSFFKLKGKMLFTPFPDYPSRMRLWKTLILKAGVNIYSLVNSKKGFDLSTLVYISNGYTAGSIQAAVQAILPPRHVAKMDQKSAPEINIDQFIDKLSKMPYTYAQEYVKYRQLTEDITGVAQRKALQAAATAAAAASASEPAPSKGKRRKK